MNTKGCKGIEDVLQVSRLCRMADAYSTNALGCMIGVQ